ncbi:MAG: hypothetical protein K0A98_03465 [Trueperaceae bacterium]|nr:hypothetical protein [Trueperaceae bacterium]
MYAALLHTHNLTRWIVLIAALVALVWALQGWLGRRPFEKRHRIANLVFVASLDVQLVLGVALYAVSPRVRAALSDMGAAMANHELRFFVVEHLSIMLVAVVLAHVGGALSRRAPDDRGKHGRALLWFGLSTLAVLFAIPWWRPLFPGMGA